MDLCIFWFIQCFIFNEIIGWEQFEALNVFIFLSFDKMNTCFKKRKEKRKIEKNNT